MFLFAIAKFTLDFSAIKSFWEQTLNTNDYLSILEAITKLSRRTIPTNFKSNLSDAKFRIRKRGRQALNSARN